VVGLANKNGWQRVAELATTHSVTVIVPVMLIAPFHKAEFARALFKGGLGETPRAR
jgi:hypothetical protein